ncbi:ABC-type nitrate/sulfonate/bicarbonate transport system substrate-binding protein [Rhizobium sp. PP-F2F-G48]|uniref:ABC transporter substrate-binding protein n=1 Tax=Rhizobium sp. PP-F2F-G48 TaxID=2135651 RepID=UPI0010ECC3C1|nr:ABC transporter substrate-binding protein [Rhizobium sp. PP-F2F-G48]TCM47193.1 ABC-type nitrate/sulfonate/bicarbonate transport system substrate-binding protein [Rhizobium sp. PP-F2F-G48]
MTILARSAAYAAALSLLTASAHAADLKKISIGLSSSSIAVAGPKLAKELGLFEKHGLEVTITSMETSTTATAGLISGSLNYVAGGPTDVIYANARGQNLVALCALYRGFSGVTVLSKATVEKLGVSPTAPVVDRAKALNGLLLASPSATSNFTMGPKLLTEAYGTKIRFTYMGQDAMSAALQSGAIQGYTASAPFYTQNVMKGDAVVWLNGPNGDYSTGAAALPANGSALFSTRTFVEANRDTSKRTCAVFDDLAKAFKERPDDVRSAMRRVFSNVDPATIDTVFKTDSPAFATKPLTKEDMAHEIAYIKASGVDLDASKIDPASLVIEP